MTDLPDEVKAALQNPTDLLKLRIMGMTMKALDHAEELLVDGNPETKLKVMQSVIPTLVKALTTQEQASEMEEMKKAMAELREQMFGTGPIDTTVTDSETEGDPDLLDGVSPLIPTDSPPPT